MHTNLFHGIFILAQVNYKKEVILISDLLITHQWEIFIAIEVFGLLALIAFAVVRYIVKKPSFSVFFLIGFILLTFLEAWLAWYVYSQTGEISAFQIIVTLFVLYAITFGYHDFKRLDRWMRKRIDAPNLLTKKDYEEMEKHKDPRFQAKYYTFTWLVHLAVFIVAQVSFLVLSGVQVNELFTLDVDWFGSESYEPTPYANETFYSVAMIWGIVFIVDTIISATYIFQKKG
ncbi:hypothetical protein [Geomicrobium sp. JCM 19039]|uniref:hypothetical protein n=1 Tax=Geomicrobium sp. JCM 19039 TaxID=1460636 RepID=UPI00045F1E32|nr:hypothetical protein [Geomicrobium sp. JCM 19039]GAK13494.1 hypothetical protein JCM19039_3347 [Geomicrobium sp. JCM 19039]